MTPIDPPDDTTAFEPRALNANDEAVERRIGFVLVPGYTFIGFACAIEPLRLANMAFAWQRFAAYVLTIDGGAVRASNGVETSADFALADAPLLDDVLICGPNPIRFPDEARHVEWLREQARRGVVLGGVDTGSFLLARAGLLDGYRATIHWQDVESLLAAFPEVIVSNRVFEIDEDRLTSGGGTSAMDMMLAHISRLTNAPETMASTAELLVWDRVRPEHEHQRNPLVQRLGTTKPKLRAAVTLMESNIVQPLTLAELADRAGLSGRQLERLFTENLDSTPSEYYLAIRLHTARSRLLYGDQLIAEVARDTGFDSPSYFSKRYRRLFGVTPSAERRRDQAGQC